MDIVILTTDIRSISWCQKGRVHQKIPAKLDEVVWEDIVHLLKMVPGYEGNTLSFLNNVR